MTREKEILKQLMKEAEYIGEDGDMVCHATTARGALIKFKRKMKEDVGEYEANELKEDDISIGWLAIPTEEEKQSDDFDSDCEWYVYYKKETPYPVYVLSI